MILLTNDLLKKLNIKNLILAGDWVDTGLPSTIESAVKSGRIAAEHCSESEVIYNPSSESK